LYELICDKNSVHIKAEMKFKNYTENTQLITCSETIYHTN